MKKFLPQDNNLLQIPDEAIKFILFQRTQYLKFPKSILYKKFDNKITRKIQKKCHFSIYNYMVWFEAGLENKPYGSAVEKI